MKVYIAGPLFTEADINQRMLEGKQLRNVVSTHHRESLGKGVNSREVVFNPIESPVNFKEMNPTAAQIFQADYDVIKEAHYFFFDLSNLDTGTFVELGQALELARTNDSVKIYPVLSDIRIPNAGNYEGLNVPVGNNQYMIGALEHYGIPIFSSFSDALIAFTGDYTR